MQGKNNPAEMLGQTREILQNKEGNTDKAPTASLGTPCQGTVPSQYPIQE